METKNFIILVLSVLSTVLVLRVVALSKQNIEGPVGSKKSLGKKNSRSLGASRPKRLGFFNVPFLDDSDDDEPTTSSAGTISVASGVPTNVPGVRSGGCNS